MRVQDERRDDQLPDDLRDADIHSPVREDPDAHATPGGAAVAGAVTGGIVGLAGGPVGAVVGAVGGAIVGAVTERVIHANEEMPENDDYPMESHPETEHDPEGEIRTNRPL